MANELQKENSRVLKEVLTAKYAGLSEGDAHVIRNAGGRASDM